MNYDTQGSVEFSALALGCNYLGTESNYNFAATFGGFPSREGQGQDDTTPKISVFPISEKWKGASG